MTELPERLLRDALRDAASTTPSAACVDVVTLAAWADGTLRAAGRATIEAHAAGCARCLALLAAMTRTEPPPIAAPWWRRSPIAWLLPLAAVTAGVVLVVRLAVLEQRPPASRPTAAPAAAAPLQRNLSQAAPAPAQTPVTSVASKAPAPARRQKHEPAAAEEGRAAVATEAAGNDTATPKPTAAPAPAPPAPAPAAPAQAPQSAQLAVSSAVGGQRGGGGRGGARALAEQITMKAAAPVPIVIASPDRDSQWRIVGAAVEHTADGWGTWQAQTIGVATPMRAGSAPDARVCWLAGVGGVVLRTTDGNIWTRVPFPEAVDLVAIEATDASHAAATTVDGRRFATSDGGAIWIRQ